MIDAYNWLHADAARVPRERTAVELASWFARAWDEHRRENNSGESHDTM